MRSLRWSLVLLMASFVPAALAQESLFIGPGDLLHVHVFDNPDLEQRTRVTDSGELALILGSTVKVAGQTPVQAARTIESALLEGHILTHPRVQVTVEEYVTQKVTVIGEVRAPGAYAISTTRSILEVLTLAGGLTGTADRRVIVQRQGSGEKVSYYFANKPDAALDTEIKVNPGDKVLVPKAGIAYALGDVKDPGGYTMTNNDGRLTVLELLARAGGTPPTAVPSHARLIHRTASGYTEEPLPLSAMQKGKKPDMVLQPDDIIYVPFSYLLNLATSASGIAGSAATAAIYRF